MNTQEFINSIKSLKEKNLFDMSKFFFPDYVLDDYILFETTNYCKDISKRINNPDELYNLCLQKLKEEIMEIYTKDDYIAEDGTEYHVDCNDCDCYYDYDYDCDCDDGDDEMLTVTLSIDENGNKKLISEKGEIVEINYNKDINIAFTHVKEVDVEPIQIVEFEDCDGKLYIYDAEKFYKSLIEKKLKNLENRLKSKIE